MCLTGGERQLGQIFGKQLAAFGRDQTITEERKTGPRAGQVDTVARGQTQSCRDLILDRGLRAQARAEPGPSHCHSEPTNRAKADKTFRIMYIMFTIPKPSLDGPCLAPRPYSGMEPDRA